MCTKKRRLGEGASPEGLTMSFRTGEWPSSGLTFDFEVDREID